MKNSRVKSALAVALLVVFSLLAGAYASSTSPFAVRPEPSGAKRIIRGVGFVRGVNQLTLRNKFAGFVKTVHVYSQQRVKKGDPILEYDDLDLRERIEALANDIAEKEKRLELKELALKRKRLDPLPSDYRNARWKAAAAEARLDRLNYELDRYTRMRRDNATTELILREKKQALSEAQADVQSHARDLETLAGGLGDLHVAVAEKEVEEARLLLENRRRELALLVEEQKYYRLTAPFDGLCITNSDTVGQYNTVGVAAAVVHRDHGKKVYAYFDERDVGGIVEGRPCRFRGAQYDPALVGYATVTPYQVKNERYTWGDRCYYLVKFTVDHEPEPLRIDSVGEVEIEVPRAGD